ncbi:helix-turn-helix domain-containing protein [Rhizobium leguminosarum]|uniref:helix-turn-helix domain-containing protein n=1 Tax=Rhizobium leguminosarum TaxID=384 RepID=UPI001C96CB01|nr:helix-turn-helix domain-containing protein [Rhizobium leguminosarum]
MTFRIFADDKLITTKQAATHLAISTKTLLCHVRKGRLGYVDVGTETRTIRRFSPSQLEEFILRRRVKETSSCPSIGPRATLTTTTTSRSTAIAFTDLQKPEADGKRSS